MTDLTKTLDERGSRYGEFHLHAEMTQALKSIMRGCVPEISEECACKMALAWELLNPDQKEALEMNAHKIGRILNGDPNYADSWVDIAGYAKLVGDRLERLEREQNEARTGSVHNSVPAGVAHRIRTENDKPEIFISKAGVTNGAVRGGLGKSAGTGKATRKR